MCPLKSLCWVNSEEISWTFGIQIRSPFLCLWIWITWNEWNILKNISHLFTVCKMKCSRRITCWWKVCLSKRLFNVWKPIFSSDWCSLISICLKIVTKSEDYIAVFSSIAQRFSKFWVKQRADRQSILWLSIWDWLPYFKQFNKHTAVSGAWKQLFSLIDEIGAGLPYVVWHAKDSRILGNFNGPKIAE